MSGAAPHTPRCPDDLLARRRAGGPLSPVEARALSAHLAGCELCSAADALGGAFADVRAQPDPGDAALLARVTGAAIAGRRRAPRPRRGWRGFAAASAVVLTAGLAGATLAWMSGRVEVRVRVEPAPSSPAAGRSPAATRPAPAPREGTLAPSVSPAPSGVAPPRGAPGRAPAPKTPAATVAAPAPPVTGTPAPPLAARVEASPAHAPMARRVATLSPLSAPVAAPPPTAALLFAAANAARRSGDRMAAVKLYRQLQQLYPASEEAIASLVSSADNHVRIDQPAEALVDLDRYLAERPAGTLAPEALFVRARCLSALRRPDDERAAWGQLLQRFPGSLYEATARRRLDELRR